MRPEAVRPGDDPGRRAGQQQLGRQRVDRLLVVVQRDPELLQVVRALAAAGRLAGLLDRREQERDQDADDRDHDE